MMKKSIGLIALVMVAMAFFVVPAMAETATSSVVVTPCGDMPIIKCKWEQDETMCMEDGDPSHAYYEPCDRNSWFAPACGQSSTVYLYAVATDPDGLSDIATVNYKVTGPCGKEWKGCLEPCGDFSNVQAANDANLLYWTMGYDLAEVEYELNACNTAAVYCDEIEINYCDPAGEYEVIIWALDKGGLESDPLCNRFVMTRLACCEYDFTEINWNTIKLGGHQVVSGDKDMTTPLRPTVKNLGNVDIDISVKEGALKDANGVSYTKNCNGDPYYVYDATILGQGYVKYFFPEDDWTLLEGYVERCNMDGLCFSLEILESMPAGSYTGDVYVQCGDAGLDPCFES